MERQLCYYPVIPLKEMALRRIAVVLVNKPEFLAAAGKYALEGSEFRRLLKTVSSKITDAASKLLLPASLTSEIKPMLKAVSSEVLRWGMYYQQFVSNFDGDFNGIVAEKLCWTTAGTVDYRKTSEMLVRSAFLDKLQRFELACLYCLEDYIPILWKELSEEDKMTFYYNEKDAPSLQLLLHYILRKHSFGCSSLARERRDPLHYAAACGNRAATEYCLGKLPKVNRETSLFETAQRMISEKYYYYYVKGMAVPGDMPNVLRYLLSLMTPEEQLRVFKERPRQVLGCFLSWPCQDLFVDIADVIWTFLPEKEYGSLLREIDNRMYGSGYYLPNIVQEVFLRSPRNFRKVFADDKYLPGAFFKKFFGAEDSQTIKVVFRSLDAADRVRLVFDDGILRLFDDFLLKGGRHLVEVCIREASLSREDRERLREAFAEAVRWSDLWAEVGINDDSRTQKRKRFFELLDEMDASTGKKRSAEDETATRVKKVCNDGNDTLPRN